jgi:hypothetical protein
MLVICALTVRQLRPGTFDEFHDAFMAGTEEMPDDWVRFNMVRNVDDPDEVICFGFFEGTAEELRAQAEEMGYAEQQEAIAPYVESVGADGLYDVIEDESP